MVYPTVFEIEPEHRDRPIVPCVRGRLSRASASNRREGGDIRMLRTYVRLLVSALSTAGFGTTPN